MPIGLGTALTAGAAVLGAGATIVASNKASKATTNAANTASNDQLAASQANNALAASEYNANASRLDPYSSMGLDAGDEYMGLLLGPAPSHASGTSPNGYVSYAPPATVGTTGSPASSGPNLAQILAEQHDGIPGNFKRDWATFQAQPQPTASALTPFNAAPASSALAPVVRQQAQQAIAAGANPQAVTARAAQFGVAI